MADVSPGMLIVQPWFTSYGHPAQSVLNTAQILGNNGRIVYLVSRAFRNDHFTEIEYQLRNHGRVESFLTPSSSIRLCTLLSLLALLRLASKARFKRILFIDAHLVLLAFCWRWLAWFVEPEKLSTIYLMGPERILRNPMARAVVAAFLSRPDTLLFLRTEELAQAWRSAFPALPENKIDVLPSLELPEDMGQPEQPEPSEELRFGVLGQVRPGKGIEWLVPMFTQHSALGTLTVAGAFINRKHAQAMGSLSAYPHFINRFLAEGELIGLAKRQHYLLMLYDNWDSRMEAATLYLAAKVNRPVIVYDSGWCGRMVRTYNCGVICKEGQASADFFQALPRPGEAGYAGLLSGLARFRDAHSGAARKEAFLDKVLKK